ncbi:hypothetical protein GZH53_09380 [Flavihumibacter sp. R14]|nr:hypothetical protein [Flavihumibacter soli]
MKKLLLIAILMLHTCASYSQSTSFMFEETKRRYLLYLPESYDPEKYYPLVYNFHGGGMTAVEQMYYTRMNRAADKYQFIVVYPAGIKSDWNVGFEMSYLKGTNDVGFIKSLTDTLKKKYRIDSKAIFATGLSRGGFFCHRLAAELPDVFAAVASVGGPLPDSVKYFIKSARKIAVMQVHGTADKVVDFEGKPGAYGSALATFNYWMVHNGLDSKNVKTRSLNANRKDATSVTIDEADGKPAGVALIRIQNGGHTWPGSDPFNIGYPLGNTTSDIDINEIMWQFFIKYKKQ